MDNPTVRHPRPLPQKDQDPGQIGMGLECGKKRNLLPNLCFLLLTSFSKKEFELFFLKAQVKRREAEVSPSQTGHLTVVREKGIWNGRNRSGS